MVKLKCGGCGKIWDYNGKAKVYACCPQCTNKVNVKKNVFIDEKSEKINDNLTVENKSNGDNISDEKKEAVEEKVSEPLQVTESDSSPTPSNLELEKEPEEPEKANPEDYDFVCPKCRELFNREGNVNNNIVKCPDCGFEGEEDNA